MKIIEINTCEDCPYFEYAYTTDPFLFVYENIHVENGRRGIKNNKIIQAWCPLKDNIYKQLWNKFKKASGHYLLGVKNDGRVGEGYTIKDLMNILEGGGK